MKRINDRIENIELTLPSLNYEEATEQYIFLKIMDEANANALADFFTIQGVYHVNIHYKQYIVAVLANQWDRIKNLLIENSNDIPYEIVSLAQLCIDDNWELINTKFYLELMHSTEFFQWLYSFHCPGGLIGFEEHCWNQPYLYTSLCPDAFITKQYPFRQQAVDEAFEPWFKSVRQQYDVYALIRHFSSRGKQEILPGSIARITNCTCNLMFMLEFCEFALNADAEMGWSANDNYLVVEILNILKNYKHISRVAEFFNMWDDTLDYYYEEYNLAKDLIEKRKEQIAEFESDN